ncbi:MAG: ADP-ribosylglycohydrolase family protein [Verrucomicrobiota bacterium]
MISRPKLIKAALTADALNLGPHWVYDQSALANAYPEGVHQLTNPLSSYHPDKTAGDFTHYGDNLVLMLRTVSEGDGWNQGDFAHRWQEFWSDTSSYCDGATRKTLARLEDHSLDASTSNDIAGASIALFLTGLLENGEPEKMIDAVRERTGFAHRDPETMDVSEFFTRVIGRLDSGDSVADALDGAASADYKQLNAAAYLKKAKSALESGDPFKVAADFGLGCSLPGAFPGVLYFLLRHPNDMVAALNENALAGGDNSARAIIIALVLTAANGWDVSLDPLWNSLKQKNNLEVWMAG